MAGTVTISGMSAGEPAGQRVFGPFTITGAMVIGETLSLLLAAGDNDITVPEGAIGVIVIPPANNSAALTYRTSLNADDSGLPLDPAQVPFVHVFPSSAPSGIVLNSQGALSAFTTVFFW